MLWFRVWQTSNCFYSQANTVLLRQYSGFTWSEVFLFYYLQKKRSTPSVSVTAEFKMEHPSGSCEEDVYKMLGRI